LEGFFAVLDGTAREESDVAGAGERGKVVVGAVGWEEPRLSKMDL
jgi:hypothetical protein